MTLFEQWKDLIENQTEETFRDFWEEYSGAETKIYSDILDKPEEKMTGTLGELAAKYEVRPVIFMGFLDGINSSLKKGNDFENFDENSEVEVEIVPETLFYNKMCIRDRCTFCAPTLISVPAKASFRASRFVNGAQMAVCTSVSL